MEYLRSTLEPVEEKVIDEWYRLLMDRPETDLDVDLVGGWMSFFHVGAGVAIRLKVNDSIFFRLAQWISFIVHYV